MWAKAEKEQEMGERKREGQERGYVNVDEEGVRAQKEGGGNDAKARTVRKRESTGVGSDSCESSKRRLHEERREYTVRNCKQPRYKRKSVDT